MTTVLARRILADVIRLASSVRLFQEDAEWLKAKLLNAALLDELTQAEEDEYGQRSVLDLICGRKDTRAIIRSGWIVLRRQAFPRANHLLCNTGWGRHD